MKIDRMKNVTDPSIRLSTGIYPIVFPGIDPEAARQ